MPSEDLNQLLPCDSQGAFQMLLPSRLYLEDLIRDFSASSLAVPEPRMTFEFSLYDCQGQIEFQSRTHSAKMETLRRFRTFEGMSWFQVLIMRYVQEVAEPSASSYFQMVNSLEGAVCPRSAESDKKPVLAVV